ncbi:mitochondrial fission ELM1 family protein [Fodinicurvata sediminis]|uniref:mitochondrial fission ELM1 family protein n=1 Tax=Fodinicurvata sediminis TaxID=1121832 RepID=UPI0003B5E6E7|nr:mitochondrial fission ELM1 family protein [Fodinicurvata sediminis]
MSDIEPSKNKVPSVWLMMGHRAGDNSQVLALAEALGWPYEIRRFVYKSYELLVNLTHGPTLSGTIPSRSSQLEPPWPDLVISAGRRNEPICRWIQEQAKAEKYVRLIHIGRPWANFERFDLIITTPQYRLPQHPHILQNKTPLHRVSQTRLDGDAEAWKGKLQDTPPPYIAVIVGGNSGPYSYDREAAQRLGKQASKLARQYGASLLVTTSARTRPDTIQVLKDAIDVPCHFYQWRPDAEDNPYFAFLGLASRIIVTADSVSMMTEACATGKPVYLFDLGQGWRAMRRQLPGKPKFLDKYLKKPRDGFDFRAFVYLSGMHLGPNRITRDIRIIHDYLISSGRAAWLGEGHPLEAPPPLEDISRAVERVHALFPQHTTGKAE